MIGCCSFTVFPFRPEVLNLAKKTGKHRKERRENTYYDSTQDANKHRGEVGLMGAGGRHIFSDRMYHSRYHGQVQAQQRILCHLLLKTTKCAHASYSSFTLVDASGEYIAEKARMRGWCGRHCSGTHYKGYGLKWLIPPAASSSNDAAGCAM